MPIKIKSKVIKFSGKRKIIEIPAVIRDNFRIGEKVFIEKIKNEAKRRKT